MSQNDHRCCVERLFISIHDMSCQSFYCLDLKMLKVNEKTELMKGIVFVCEFIKQRSSETIRGNINSY